MAEPHGIAARAAQAPEPRRILVHEVNWLGDLVMSVSALRALRRAFPQAHLAVAVSGGLASFFDGASLIDELVILRGGAWRGLRDAATLRAGNFDLAVLLPNSFESALRVALARIPVRLGFVRDGRGLLLSRGVHPQPPGRQSQNQNQVEEWRALLRTGLAIEPAAEDDFEHQPLAPHAPHRAAMATWLAAHRRRPGARLLALAPGAGFGPAKQWPGFAELLARLGAQGFECVVLGSAGEQAKCESLCAANPHALVAAGQTSVGELIGLLSLCDGFVGNDSGPAHLASALGLPAVKIYGSTTPRHTGALGPRSEIVYLGMACSPCASRTCRFGHYRCLTDISVEAVLAAMARQGLGA